MADEVTLSSKEKVVFKALSSQIRIREVQSEMVLEKPEISSKVRFVAVADGGDEHPGWTLNELHVVNARVAYEATVEVLKDARSRGALSPAEYNARLKAAQSELKTRIKNPLSKLAKEI